MILQNDLAKPTFYLRKPGLMFLECFNFSEHQSLTVVQRVKSSFETVNLVLNLQLLIISMLTLNTEFEKYFSKSLQNLSLSCLSL